MDTKIELNFKRLSSQDYDVNHIFPNKEYSWPGDYEGRALLAFVSHYNISHRRLKNMDDMILLYPTKINSEGYFGNIANPHLIDEQQLSGHSWLLRGLLSYYETFNDNKFLTYSKNIFENLFYKIKDGFQKYPLERTLNNDGDVSGSSNAVLNGWKLSTDIGCAFISIDGLSHYFKVTKDIRAKEMIDLMLEKYRKIDFIGMKVQTHATLSSTRGILRMYEVTGDNAYLDLAISMFDLYLNNGMTLTYENFNWFKREDTWTEPCAVIDSLILSIKLYKILNLNFYKSLARRIYFNGLSFCQRDNGGVGPNSCVTPNQPILKVMMYEAYFCCTMRYAEGLKYIFDNKEMFTWDSSKNEVIDSFGRHFIDDKLLVKYNNQIVPIFSSFELEKSFIDKAELLIIY